MTSDQSVLNGLLGELSQLWQLDGLTLNKSGRCSLITEDNIQIAIDLAPGSSDLQLLAGVGVLHDSDREQQLTELMRRNFEHVQLGQAYFALSSQSDHILLRYLCPFEDMDINTLTNVVGNFIQIATDAVKQLNDLWGAEFSHEPTVNYEPRVNYDPNVRHYADLLKA
ncbi:hypothetical protein BS333_05600 [Vibrio azureus]|uniref:Uncharacterized protein n=1 Tax=Vibrio azureus NBRC 104587 TaxID=1219077 RepID=U3CIP2_9VIBR|nr:type III secretion system chaperone [Vibrio azureus]AUI85895.1 hypothetical protein BS333_05600 [Vibrio azureus]GAD78113.1 hypothetical protein VAZ01S_126_00050 [Vibrio azureus NBRC 104587]